MSLCAMAGLPCNRSSSLSFVFAFVFVFFLSICLLSLLNAGNWCDHEKYVSWDLEQGPTHLCAEDLSVKVDKAGDSADQNPQRLRLRQSHPGRI